MKSWEGSELDCLMAAKLEPPQSLVTQIERPLALGALEDARCARLTLLVSPAGFGKTTLLAQWRTVVRTSGGIAGWVSLDEDDGDPLQFLATLVLSLVASGAELGELEKTAGQGFTEVPLTAAVAGFLNSVARLGEPIILILDDYHRVQSAPLDQLIEGILNRAPDNLHMVLSSRERPALTLAKLKARGMLHEIGIEALRFRIEDALPLFDDTLDRDAIVRLVERTEGWGVALQLAKLWLQGTGNRADLMERYSGRTADLADYFAEQVFRDLDKDAAAILLDTAVCERINGDLANAMTGRTDCRNILAWLERLHVLLIPLDGERYWFRCHLLFREFLLDILQRRAPERIAALHLSASRWFEDQGLTVEAVRHARVAGDYDRVTSLIAAAGGWELILFGGIGMLRSLLRGIPQAICCQYAALRYARIYLHIKDGELGEARALIASGMPQDLLAPAEDSYRNQRDGLLIGGVIDGYEDKWVNEDDFRRLTKATEAFYPTDHIGLGALYESIAVVALRLGDSPAVEDAAIKAVHHMRTGNSILGLNYAYFHLGQVQMISGRLREAEATFREALATAEENFGVDSGQKAIADVLLAAVLYLKNDLQAAEAHLTGSLTHLEENDSWFDILATGYETAAHLALELHGLDEAIVILDRAAATARRRGLRRLLPLIAAERIRILVGSGELGQAETVLQSRDFTFVLGDWRSNRHVWRTHHQSGIALASCHIAHGACANALEVLEDVRTLAEDGKRLLHLAQADVMEAVVLRMRGDVDAAIDKLMGVIRLAIPEGASRIVLAEASAMEPLLAQALRQQRAQTVDSLVRVEIARLLDTMKQARIRSGVTTNHNFSAREIEVLNELAHGYSNKEIARALNMTENTVKFHLKNIYTKLKVDKRGGAVAKARAEALIV
ncbi:MAG: hypothetical protein IT495_02770 [Gammaproteobacteria bacterium]|nr:hypothetical protein [Gammaproteobacteria bacterium]